MTGRYIRAGRAEEWVMLSSYEQNRLAVDGPVGLHLPTLVDPSIETGYVHSFLRPFQAAVLGRWNWRKGRPVMFTNIETIAYILLEGTDSPYLRSVGAVSLAKAKNGYTIAFFPAFPRMRKHKREVDHLSVHFSFESGMIGIRDAHAKIRFEGDLLCSGNVPFDHFSHNDAYFALEYWCRGFRYLDPAVRIESTMPARWTDKKDKKRLRMLINRARVVSIGISAPTPDGMMPDDDPFLLRIGLVSDSRARECGGFERAIGNPLCRNLRGKHMKTHLYHNVGKLAANWPTEVTLFMEIGLLDKSPRAIYSLPNISRRTVDSTMPSKNEVCHSRPSC